MRSLFLALVVLLALSGAVSASSADWNAPEWSSDAALSASELEARHSEFLMATSGTGAGNDSSSSSSSTAPFVPLPVIDIAPAVVELSCSSAANATNPCAFNSSSLAASVKDAFNFPVLFGEAFFANLTSVPGSAASSSSTGAVAGSSTAAAASSSSSSTAARRLLQTAGGTKASFLFIGSPVDGGLNARTAYAALVESLRCSTAECRDEVASKYSFPTGKLSANPAFTQLAAQVVPGTLVVDEAAVAGANAALSGDREVPTVGGPRDTNGGYYFLGALLIAFILAALIYMIVHKKPAAAVTKEVPRRDEVALAPVVAAPVAGAAPASGVVVGEDQALAAGGQQQMDYRSVFALKHNVLDKSGEQKAAEEDEHNHNDVHFILHQ